MKIAVNTTTKKIVDILPDGATESHKFLVNNNYKLLDVENPMIGGEFRELTYDELLPILAIEAKEEYELKANELIANTPSSEVSTWTKQEAEARAYLLDNTASTPLIDAIYTAREVEKIFLVSKIIEKADAYSIAIGTLLGTKQKQEKQLTPGE